MTTTINPTHNCFDDACEIFVDLLAEYGFDGEDGPFLIHAIIAPEGERLAHAWVEFRREAMFKGYYNGGELVTCSVNRFEYRENSKIEELMKYGPREALRESKRRGGLSGPWESRYLELCRDYEPGASQ